MKIKYIYTISHPVTKVIVYVGASYNVEERAKVHVTTRIANTVYVWMQDVLRAGLKPVFTIVDKTDGDWRELERQWILKLFSDGCPLVNVICKGLKRQDNRFVIVDNLTRIS